MSENITLLKYSNTNTYLIEGTKGSILFDTGWAGTFQSFCRELGGKGKTLQQIDYIMISHFHPDHMGIAGEIAEKGPKIVILDLQKPFIHFSDSIFEKDKIREYKALKEDELVEIKASESAEFLSRLGINGKVIHTPGHSDDSISLILDDGAAFVGDLNPLYELELHRGTEIEKSWNRILAYKPARVYYGHANMAELGEAGGTVMVGGIAGEAGGTVMVGGIAGEAGGTVMVGGIAVAAGSTGTVEAGAVAAGGTVTVGGGMVVSGSGEKHQKNSGKNSEYYKLTADIIKYIDKGYSMEKIERKTGADPVFIEDVNRMYLTHQNVGVQGILDRIEIKNR